MDQNPVPCLATQRDSPSRSILIQTVRLQMSHSIPYIVNGFDIMSAGRSLISVSCFSEVIPIHLLNHFSHNQGPAALGYKQPIGVVSIGRCNDPAVREFGKAGLKVLKMRFRPCPDNNLFRINIAVRFARADKGKETILRKNPHWNRLLLIGLIRLRYLPSEQYSLWPIIVHGISLHSCM
jgi:hypothetical protein